MAVGNKTGGRKAGTPNKTTGHVRDLLSGIIAKELESLERTLAELPAPDRVQAVIRLMAYVIPKPAQINEPAAKQVFDITMNLSDEPTPLSKLDKAIQQFGE
jgi:hypothetical protein